jgi:hypothetical protein
MQKAQKAKSPKESHRAPTEHSIHPEDPCLDSHNFMTYPLAFNLALLHF